MNGYIKLQNHSLPMWDVEPNDKLRHGHKFTRRLAQEWRKKWLCCYTDGFKSARSGQAQSTIYRKVTLYFYLMIPFHPLAVIYTPQLWERKCAKMEKCGWETTARESEIFERSSCKRLR